MECCICYETPKPNTCIFTTSCNHVLCLSCLIKINKDTCPYCRQELKDIPEEIKKLLKNNKPHSKYVHLIDERLQNIPFEIIVILNQIKTVSNYHYENMVGNINNGQNYDISYLRDFYQDLYRENINISRIRNINQ